MILEGFYLDGCVPLGGEFARLEELDIEAAINYATNALRNAAKFWIQCSADQKQNFQRVLFTVGLMFDRESYRTAPTWRPVRDRTRVAAVKEKTYRNS